MFTFSLLPIVIDLQTVNITLRILYRPQADLLPKIYSNLGFDYEERVLPSITTEVLKAVVAQFDASELITQREIVSQRVNEYLTERAASFGILLDDIALVCFLNNSFMHTSEWVEIIHVFPLFRLKFLSPQNSQQLLRLNR